MPSTRSTGPTSRSAALRVGILCCLGLGAAGCGDAPRRESPRVPPPVAQLVERDAPFIVDWDAAQIASLTSAIRSPNLGTVVVAYQHDTIRLLPDCSLSGGIYVPSGIGMYRGLLQVRPGDSPAAPAGVRPDALQQVSTSASVAPGTLLNYRIVVAGRHAVSGTRSSAKLLELSERVAGGCRGATHFVRAALTGAFELMKDIHDTVGAQAGSGAAGSGQSQPARVAEAGDFARCLTAGTAADPACSAFVKIELSPLQPVRVDLRIVSFTPSGAVVPTLQLRFRGKNSYVSETRPITAAAAALDWVLPAVEIAEDAPLVVEVLQPTSGGAQVIASGEVTPAELRRAVFDVELRTPTGGGKLGKVQLAASESAAAP
jgi:hypothetical protein